MPETCGGDDRSPARGQIGVPLYSIVIPIHNEAECLEEEVAELVGELEDRAVDYELLLAENGSYDDTPVIAEKLAACNLKIRVMRIPTPDYGAAMKAGMLAAQGELVVNFDIDFHDMGFMLEAGKVLRGGGTSPVSEAASVASSGVTGKTGTVVPGIVVGSKLMEGAEDRRSGARHLVSLGFTTILRLLFDRRMDDTHGMKVLRREVVRLYAPHTVMTRDLFDTELIIRARRGGVVVRPLPVTVEEKRKPRSSIVRRIPRTIRGLVKLRIVLWKEGSAGA
ncbi:MAG: glycosyltransferase family 2 protein [Actinobacteria bacterium]|nr:glycosyltransferase family 2 protein [Actinomycetota bacterium]